MRRTLLAVSALLATAAGAQPASQFLDTAPVDRLVLPAQDNAALQARAESARQRSESAPMQIAESIDVSVQGTSGTWETAGDGTRIWRLAVSSPGAYSLSFGFSRFWLPEGASLWIYPEGGDPEYRPFTHLDNEDHGQLWTPIVPGGHVVIEVNVPPAKSPLRDAEIELARVNHSFVPALLTASEKAALGASKSGSCNVDVACPEGDGYRDVIRSVGHYTITNTRGTFVCTGSMVNNTAEDQRALFLTADHCGINPSTEASVVVYWNFQNSTCRTPGSAASGGNGDGPRDTFNSGVSLLDADVNDLNPGGPSVDWSIVEPDDPIPEAANVFFAGWDRRDAPPSSVVTIHHPSGDEKRISFENDPTTTTLYLRDGQSASGTHIRIDDWDVGTTEGGSSGSPLFNSEKRVVGILSGGFASCSSQTADWYGRLSSAMDAGLAAFLDPSGSGVETLDGRNGTGSVSAGATVSESQPAPGETIRFTYRILNGTADSYSGASFSNTLPDGLDFSGALSSSLGTATEAAGTISWTGTFGPGEELVVSYDAVVESSASGIIENVASLSFGAGNSVTASASVTVVTVRPEPDLILEAVPGASIPDNGCSSSSLTSTINVSDAMVLARVSVGVGITHTYRGDLRVALTSPSGTTVSLIDRVGSGNFGSNADNLDVLIDDAGQQGAFASNNHAFAPPYYDIEGAPESGSNGSGVGALASFIGESAQGTWTLDVCDGAADDTGTLERWALYLVEQPAGTVDGEEGPQAGPLAATVVGSNPASEVTRVQVSSSRAQDVQVTIVDASGREVRRVADRWVSGTVTLDVNLSGLASGTYFVRVHADGERQSLPISVVR